MMTVASRLTTLKTSGRCDDREDDIVASQSLAQKAVMMGIGKLEQIAPTSVQMPILCWRERLCWRRI